MQYDANVKVTVTVEYPDETDGENILEQRRSDVKDDIEQAFRGFDVYLGNAHVFVTDVLSTGGPSPS